MARPLDEPAILFKDFYQILQLQPDADSEMIDQAYWHLARVCNTESDSWARSKLDELNEAYSVLRSPALRVAYDKIRDGVLGERAPPAPPRVQPPRPPLPVMNKQRDRSPAETADDVVEDPRPRRGKLGAPSLVQKLARLATLPRWPGRRRSSESEQPAVAGHDLAALFEATEAARARWHASIPDAPATNEPDQAPSADPPHATVDLPSGV